MTATRTDGDGDSTPASADVGNQFKFDDDGPTLTADTTGAPSITDDETVLGTDNTGDYSGNFTAVFGADGAAVASRSYSLSTSGGASGLVESGTGLQVFLFKVGNNIVGKAGSTLSAAQSGTEVVFVVSIDQNGVVTLDQQKAVVHDPNLGPDQSTTLSSGGLVVVNATAYDGDGDSASASLNIGQLLNFKDDAPTITAQILGDSVAFSQGSSVSHSLNGAVGADNNSSTSQSLSNVMQYTITGFDEPTSVYPNLDGVLSADGTTLTYYSDSTHTLAVYQLTLNQTANSGAGSYTFSVLQPPPIVNNHFDFTDLPSGQNLFGIIATNKGNVSNNGTPNNPADDYLPDGGLLVFPNNPHLNPDGTYDNTSGTINTSKGGGPVTIGNGNQAFDHPLEGAYFMYVDDPLVSATGAMGLTQITADDADTIGFNGVNQATRASVTIVQASGQGTVKQPGPGMQIYAYEANPGHVDTTAEARAVVNDPTSALANQGTAAPQVNIIGIKIHDATGKVIEYRTLDQSNGAAVLQDSDDAGTGISSADDSAVDIVFFRDKGGDTVTTSDDIYSVQALNLKAGYTIEFITATNHDLAQVVNVSGSFDIGGFNVVNQANVAGQDFHFSVGINDYDNDFYGGPSVAYANFAVHVNDVTFI
jgi:hypothetical protein